MTLGHVAPGDGIKFRGWGAIQVTGLYNYTQYWLYRGWLKRGGYDDPWWNAGNKRIPIINDPQRLSARVGVGQHDTLDASLAYWARLKINNKSLSVSDQSIKTVSYAINAAAENLNDRIIQTKAADKGLNDQP